MYTIEWKDCKRRWIEVVYDFFGVSCQFLSFTDRDKYPQNIFANLYHLRWPVEEDYKTMKCRLQLENFSGKSALSGYQDFHTKVFSENFTAIIANTTKDEIEKLSEHRNS